MGILERGLIRSIHMGTQNGRVTSTTPAKVDVGL